MEPVGIYLHIPFCASKCPYCDFYSLPAREEAMDGYTQALTRAIANCPYPAREVDTIYFGGGTPILMGPKRLERILDALTQRFTVDQKGEITLEANPAATLLEPLTALRRAGFNRISFGVQSAVAEQLKLLGRRHTIQMAEQAVNQSRQAGFDNISVDIMMGLPGQTLEDGQVTADFCMGLGVEHISAYLLKIEPGTPFARRYTQPLEEELPAQLYLQTVAQLEAAGYRQYEISNFARPGRESRHNLKYWNCDHYLGIGPAAYSYWENRRFGFPRDLEGFCAAKDPWALASDWDRGGDFEEYVMLRLRLNEGLVFTQASARYPHCDLRALQNRAKPLATHGLLTLDENHLALTPQGMLVSNEIITRILG